MRIIFPISPKEYWIINADVDSLSPADTIIQFNLHLFFIFIQAQSLHLILFKVTHIFESQVFIYQDA